MPVEVLPSPQSMVAGKALAGSTPLAWVKVATVKLDRLLCGGWMGSGNDDWRLGHGGAGGGTVI